MLCRSLPARLPRLALARVVRASQALASPPTSAHSRAEAAGMAGASTRALQAEVQRSLAEAGDSATAVGQDGYFKGVIKHRGISTPAVDALMTAFLKENADIGAGELRSLAEALLAAPLQEDKLAGICCWRHALLKKGGAAEWRSELAALHGAYTAGHVFAWSTCDWLCGRLLAPLIKQLLRQETAEGEACAKHVMGWCREDNLWLRRSSVVAFVTLARLPDEQVFPGFRSSLLDTLATVVQERERFAQTGVGWVLREVGKGDSEQLLQFVEAHLPHFSSEGLRYALERQPAAVRQPLAAKHKAALKAAAGGAGDAGGVAEEEAAAAAASVSGKRQQGGPKRRRRG